ncbi:MAG: hypothetical protein HY655_09000 [Acidobacteria bacterium]|nr:hypothetical protein [Acidobacteriota bacterium]
MRLVAATVLCLSAASLCVVVDGDAQERPATATTDPRVGLKAGFRGAEVAVKNMALVSSSPRPAGFFDPANPAGTPTSPETNTSAPAGAAASSQPAATPAETPETPARPPSSGLNFANSDLAFSRNRVFIGNFNGFNTYDVDSTKRPRLLASVVCPGGQGDLSIHGNLLFMSVEQTRGRIDCGTQGVQAAVSAERFRGIRIFDISNVGRPKQVAAIQTCRGSHTHTLVVDPKDKANVYIYGSGTGAVRSAEELAECSGKDPKEDPNTSLASIDVIKVPITAPDKAAIINRPRIFADPTTGALAGLWQGGNFGPGTQTSRATNQCHDITVFPEVGLAAGACSGNGLLLDISDPVHPVRLDAVTDKNFAYWHSATFNNDGTKVIFTDEWGGGTRPRCRATDMPTWGANAIFDVVDRKLAFAGYYKLPAAQTEQENCVAHNGSLVPVPGRDIMVQGWYQGGVSVFDFTDSAKPVEIAYFDRGPIDAEKLITGGYWSAYWYNGHIYGSEIARGIDVFELKPSDYLSQNEIDAANLVRTDVMNVQHQQRTTWPSASVVARAYLDQLGRTKGIQPERARAVTAALDRADDIQSARDKNAAAVAGELDALAAQVESDAGAPGGHEAARLRSLAATLKGRAARLR